MEPLNGTAGRVLNTQVHLAGDIFGTAGSNYDPVCSWSLREPRGASLNGDLLEGTGEALQVCSFTQSYVQNNILSNWKQDFRDKSSNETASLTC